METMTFKITQRDFFSPTDPTFFLVSMDQKQIHIITFLA